LSTSLKRQKKRLKSQLVSTRMSENRTIETPEQFVELKRECIERVRWAVKRINEKLGILVPDPQIIFSITGTTAGRAHIGRNLIEFNPVLLRDNSDEFLNRTPGHEVAHLAAHLKFGHKIRAHGDEWCKCMWCLGLPAIRCHNYDTTNAAPRGSVPVRRPTNKTIQTVDGPMKQVGIGRIIEFE
jgi:predicted SprT family Zn-dependent metalloprotease